MSCIETWLIESYQLITLTTPKLGTIPPYLPTIALKYRFPAFGSATSGPRAGYSRFKLA